MRRESAPNAELLRGIDLSVLEYNERRQDKDRVVGFADFVLEGMREIGLDDVSASYDKLRSSSADVDWQKILEELDGFSEEKAFEDRSRFGVPEDYDKLVLLFAGANIPTFNELREQFSGDKYERAWNNMFAVLRESPVLSVMQPTIAMQGGAPVFYGVDLRGIHSFPFVREFLKAPRGRFDGSEFSGKHWKHVDLRAASFVGSDLSDGRFVSGDFSGADFTGAKLDGCTFDPSVKLGNAIFDGASTVGAVGLNR